MDGPLHLLEIRLQAIQLSPISHGPLGASLHTPGHDHRFAAMLLFPYVFRLQVRHQTQERTSEFLPATPGIRQDASWRTMLLSPSPFGSRLGIRPRNIPPSSSHLRWEYDNALHGALILDEAPVFRPVCTDDREVVTIQQSVAALGFSVLQVGSALGFDHLPWDAQCDAAIDRRAGSAVLDSDLVAEESAARVRACVISVLSGFSSNLSSSRRNCARRCLISSASAFGPANPRRVVIGVPTVAEPPVARILRVLARRSPQLFSQLACCGRKTAPLSAHRCHSHPCIDRVGSLLIPRVYPG